MCPHSEGDRSTCRVKEWLGTYGVMDQPAKSGDRSTGQHNDAKGYIHIISMVYYILWAWDYTSKHLRNQPELVYNIKIFIFAMVYIE